VAELGCELHLTLETREVLLRARVKELHGRRSAEHRVARAEDLAHPAFAELLEERVLAELLRLAHLAPQTVNDVRRQGTEDHDQTRPRERVHEQLGGRRHGDEGGGRPALVVHGERDGEERRGHQARDP
jgi:hypothetical protein